MYAIQSWGDTLRLLVELSATAAFALSGLMEAARKRLDAVGVCVVAFLAAFGGGTLRDLLLGIPNRNAARLAAMADPDEVRALLQSEIEGALRSLPSG